MRRIGVIVPLIATAAAVPAAGASAATATIRVASLTSTGAVSPLPVLQSALSGDGTTAAFLTVAALDPADDNRTVDLFVSDAAGPATWLTKHPAVALPTTASGIAISHDGHLVAVGTTAPLVATDTDTKPDIYVYDRSTPEAPPTRIPTVTPGWSISLAKPVAISADGRLLTYITAGSTGPQANSSGNILQRDLQTGAITVVDNDAFVAPISTEATAVAASSDGRWVAFVSGGQIRLRDTATNSLTLVSQDNTGRPTWSAADLPQVSDDGAFVAFRTSASLVADDTDGVADVYLRDVAAGVTERVSTHSSGDRLSLGDGGVRSLSMDASGRRIAFTAERSQVHLDGTTQYPYGSAYLRDRATGSTVLIDVADDGSGLPMGGSVDAHLSADGSQALLRSNAASVLGAPGPHNYPYEQAVLRSLTDLQRATDASAPGSSWVQVPTPVIDVTAPPVYRPFTPDRTAHLECRTSSDGPWAGCDSTDQFPLPTGTSDVWVRAVDAAGNVEASPASLRDQAPWASLPAPTGHAGNSSGVVPTPSPDTTVWSDLDATKYCRVDSEPWAQCPTWGQLHDLAEGPHVFDMQIQDSDGRRSVVFSHAFRVDTIAPGLISAVGDTLLGPARPELPLTYSEPVTLTCRIDGALDTPCQAMNTGVLRLDSSMLKGHNLTAGTHSVSLLATDAAGHAAAPATVTFRYDGTAPKLTLKSVASPTKDSTPSFSFSADETGSTFRCSVDGAAAVVCKTGFTTAKLKDGKHTVTVTAVDRAGNPSKVQSASFTVDRRAPQTEFTARPASVSRDRTPTSKFKADESGATFTCRIDKGSWRTCRSAWTTSTLKPGDHTISVRATDKAGNTDSSPVAAKIVVKR